MPAGKDPDTPAGAGKNSEEHGHEPIAWTTDVNGKPVRSWRTALLPFCDKPYHDGTSGSFHDLYPYQQAEPWDSPANGQLSQKVPRFLTCPYTSLDQLSDRLLTTADDEHGDPRPPMRARLVQNGRVVCVEETEFWVMCGGPEPYHDSYTLSFYTREEVSQRLEVACSAACEQLTVVVKDVTRASPHPSRESWWKHILRNLIPRQPNLRG